MNRKSELKLFAKQNLTEYEKEDIVYNFKGNFEKWFNNRIDLIQDKFKGVFANE